MLGSRIALLSVHRATHSPARRINETVHDKRAITADVALRLSRALRLGDMFWIDMQAHHDAEIAPEDSDRANRLNSRKIRGVSAALCILLLRNAFRLNARCGACGDEVGSKSARVSAGSLFRAIDGDVHVALPVGCVSAVDGRHRAL